MAYTAPSTLTFDLSSAPTYTAPSNLLFSFQTFVSNSNITVAPASTMTAVRHHAITGSTVINIQPKVFYGNTKINIAPTSDTLYTSNNGGRLYLITGSNYVPFIGSAVSLQASQGFFVNASEPQSTTSFTVDLSGAALPIADTLPVVDSTAALTGAVVTAGDALPVADVSAYVYGGSGDSYEPVPVVDSQGGVIREIFIRTTLDVPTIAIAVDPPTNELTASGTFPALSPEFAILESGAVDLRATFPGLQSTISYAAAGANTIAGAFPGFTLALTSSGAAGTISSTFPGLSASASIMSGDILRMSAELPLMQAAISFSQPQTISINATFTPPTMSAGATGSLSISAVFPGFTLSTAVGDSVAVRSTFPALSPTITLDGGLTLSATFPALSLSAQCSGENLSAANTFPTLSFKGAIDTGSVIGGTFPSLDLSATILTARDMTAIGVLPVLSPSIKLSAASTGAIKASLLLPTASIGSVATVSLNARLPILTSSIYAGDIAMDFA